MAWVEVDCRLEVSERMGAIVLLEIRAPPPVQRLGASRRHFDRPRVPRDRPRDVLGRLKELVRLGYGRLALLLSEARERNARRIDLAREPHVAECILIALESDQDPRARDEYAGRLRCQGKRTREVGERVGVALLPEIGVRAIVVELEVLAGGKRAREECHGLVVPRLVPGQTASVPVDVAEQRRQGGVLAHVRLCLAGQGRDGIVGAAPTRQETLCKRAPYS